MLSNVKTYRSQSLKVANGRCAYCPKVKQDVARPARGDSVRAEGRKEAAKLNEERTEAVEAEG